MAGGGHIIALMSWSDWYKVEQLPWPADWAALFGRAAPLVVEIGFGTGRFLIDLARRRPEVNVLGLEISIPAVRIAGRKVQRGGLPNVVPVSYTHLDVYKRQVSSGVGVWLRGAPSTTGEQLEWLLDGTLVTLLGQQETADDLLWEQVRTEGGVEGWVASDFLSITAP